MRHIPKSLRIPVLIGLAAAGLMVTSTLPAAASTAADTKPPTPPYIQAIFPLEPRPACKAAMRIMLSTDNITPQNEIRYQVFSNGVPIPGLLLADTRFAPPGFGYITFTYVPAPTAQRFTLEAVDRAGNRSDSSPFSRELAGPCS